MRNGCVPIVLLLISVSSTSCGRDTYPDRAYADIENSQGQGVGTVAMQEAQNGVRFHLYVHGLPKGTYTFAVHDFGECDLPDFINAGNPFPPNANAGTASETAPHTPTLGEVHLEQDGAAAQAEVLTDAMTLKEGSNSLFHPGGTSLVLFAKTADAMGAPKRVACGLITQFTGEEGVPQKVPEGDLEDANTPRDMDIPGEIHRQPK